MALALARRIRTLLPPDAWRQSIAVIQVFGGGLGMANLLLSAWGDLSRNDTTLGNLLGAAGALVALFILYAASFVAGIGLWSEERHARPLSMIVQALQVIQFKWLGVSYAFIVAGGLSLFVDGERIGVAVRNGSSATVDWGRPSQPAMLGFNVVALAFYYVLYSTGNDLSGKGDLPA